MEEKGGREGDGRVTMWFGDDLGALKPIASAAAAALLLLPQHVEKCVKMFRFSNKNCKKLQLVADPPFATFISREMSEHVGWRVQGDAPLSP